MNNKTKQTYVIGHKNPDTDSICSAIAYCDIKNRTSQKQRFVPKRLIIVRIGSQTLHCG